jgi:putative ABC transport system permease protein
MWAGIDSSVRPLKPWWHFKSDAAWFDGPDTVILGSEAAVTEMRKVGDRLYSPELKQDLRVAAVLERSGTSDDSLFFLPLPTAQRLFHQEGRVTAIGIRLKDPALAAEAGRRLQRIPGAQVVTMGEMMGTFNTLVSSVRSLMLAIAILGLCISGLTVFNTMLAMMIERTPELGVMRAAGASRGQVTILMLLESLILTCSGSAAGLLLTFLVAPAAGAFARALVPLAPSGSITAITPLIACECAAIGAGLGLIAGLYPALRAASLSPIQAMKGGS